MESAEDRLRELVLKGENGKFRVMAARVTAAPTAMAALVINSLLLSCRTAISDLSIMVPSRILVCESSRKLAKILLTNDKSDCTLREAYFKVPSGNHTGMAGERAREAL